jgi:hypothetical protein
MHLLEQLRDLNFFSVDIASCEECGSAFKLESVPNKKNPDLVMATCKGCKRFIDVRDLMTVKTSRAISLPGILHLIKGYRRNVSAS